MLDEKVSRDETGMNAKISLGTKGRSAVRVPRPSRPFAIARPPSLPCFLECTRYVYSLTIATATPNVTSTPRQNVVRQPRDRSSDSAGITTAFNTTAGGRRLYSWPHWLFSLSNVLRTDTTAIERTGHKHTGLPLRALIFDRATADVFRWSAG